MAAIGQERDQDVTAYAGFTGLRNDVAAERFTASDLAVAVNVDLDKSGRLARRDGYANVLAGAAHSLWANNTGDTAYLVQGSVLKRLATNYTAAAVKTLSSNDRMAFCEVDDHVFFTNGTDCGVMQDGVARLWGIDEPGMVGITTTVGALTAGRYGVTMTYVREDGQESGAGVGQYIDLQEGQAINLQLPMSADPYVVAKIVYVTPANGDMFYQAQMVGNTVTSLQWNGGDLSRPLDFMHLRRPPAGQALAFYRGHMLVAAGDALFASEPFGYEVFDLRKYLQLDGRITMLAPILDKESGDTAQNSGMFIGTERSCGVLVGSSLEDFQYVPKLNYGAIPGALAMVDGSLFGDGSAGARQLPLWLTTQGICAGMPGMTIQNLTRTKYSFAANGAGAAVFIPGVNRFIANFNL